MRSILRTLTALGLLALPCLVAPPAHAHDDMGWPCTPPGDGTYPWFMRDEPIHEIKTPVLNKKDPDHTGYPMINSWRGSLRGTSVGIHLNTDERDRLTELRVTTSEKLQKAFGEMITGFRPLLDRDQRVTFDALITRLDTAALAAQDEHEWTAFRHGLIERLRLSGAQAAMLRPMLDELQTSAATIHSELASSFEEVVASAERRTAAERLKRSLGTGAP